MIKNKNLIFLGAPGVGKGTIAAILAKNKGLKHISTGDIFRNEIKNKTKLGLQVEEILRNGAYVSDDITNEIVKGVMQDESLNKTGFILDGYPRTVAQAQFLKDINVKIDAVVLLNSNEDIIVERLLKRGRPDDTKETIKERFVVYNNKTKPLIDFYSREGKVIEIDASGDVDSNYASLIKVL